MYEKNVFLPIKIINLQLVNRGCFCLFGERFSRLFLELTVIKALLVKREV